MSPRNGTYLYNSNRSQVHGKKVTINGTEIALFCYRDTFYALDEKCPHLGTWYRITVIQNCMFVADSAMLSSLEVLSLQYWKTVPSVPNLFCAIENCQATPRVTLCMLVFRIAENDQGPRNLLLIRLYTQVCTNLLWVQVLGIWFEVKGANNIIHTMHQSSVANVAQTSIC